jgi:hypothetical protein
VKYQLNTEVREELVIQTLVEDHTKILARWVCDTRNYDIQKALIDLGWTPPNKEK